MFYHPFVSFVINIVNALFCKRMNRFCCKMTEMVHFGDQEVKSQGHRRLKLDMEAWRRHYCEKKPREHILIGLLIKVPIFGQKIPRRAKTRRPIHLNILLNLNSVL